MVGGRGGAETLMGAQHSKGYGLGNGLVNVTKAISDQTAREAKQRFAEEAVARRMPRSTPHTASSSNGTLK
jgi:hypothetical protein